MAWDHEVAKMESLPNPMEDDGAQTIPICPAGGCNRHAEYQIRWKTYGKNGTELSIAQYRCAVHARLWAKKKKVEFPGPEATTVEVRPATATDEVMPTD